MAFRLMFKLRVDAKKLFEHPAVPIIVGFYSHRERFRRYTAGVMYSWLSICGLWSPCGIKPQTKKMASVDLLHAMDSRSCANGDHVLVMKREASR